MAEAIKLSIKDEKMQFEFSAKLKLKLYIAIGIGVVLFILGVVMLASGFEGILLAEHHEAGATHHGGEQAEAEHHGAAYHWTTRMWANLWLCAVYFTGISVIGVFFLAVNYVGWAGWSAMIKRVPEAFGYFLPIGFAVLFVVFLASGDQIFAWKGEHAAHDPILVGKSGYLNVPFYLIRMGIYFAAWFGLFMFLRSLSLKEDKVDNLKNYLANPTYYNKMVYFSAVFLFFFAITSSMAAWDWTMSIDAHWFSTMWGWYNFASWFVAGLATINLAVLFMKDSGYFKLVNRHHFHDLGKFMFAFSIFWTYITFCQFLLIYYAHLPEEAIYYDPRLFGTFRPLFFLNFFINFIFPFLALMAMNAKRSPMIMKVIAGAILFGHYIDFYLMIMPGAVGDHAGFGLVELGSVMTFASIFIYTVAYGLSKAPVIAKNHPFLKESVNFTQFA
jgi:hypothetical protein